MLASRQLLGVARSRAVGSASLGLRRMATVGDSPLDRKVSTVLFFFWEKMEKKKKQLAGGFRAAEE